MRTEVPAEISTAFLDLGVFCFPCAAAKLTALEMADGGGACRLALVGDLRGWQLAYFLPAGMAGWGWGPSCEVVLWIVALSAEPKGSTELRAALGGGSRGVKTQLGQRKGGGEGWARVPALSTLCPQGPWGRHTLYQP